MRKADKLRHKMTAQRKSVQKTATAPSAFDVATHTKQKELMSRRVNPRQTMDRWEVDALGQIGHILIPMGLAVMKNHD
jgi:hypothetical protein